MAGIEQLEAAAAAMGDTVKELKAGGAAKEEIDAGVAALVTAKAALAEAIQQKLGTLAEGTPEYVALQAKLPPPPKPSKKDKKKEAPAADEADQKEANKKRDEEAKLAARARRKAEAAAKPDKPKEAPVDRAAGSGAAAAASPAAAPSVTTAAAASAPSVTPAAGASAPAAAAASHAKKREANKNFELHFAKEAPPLLAIMAAKLARQEVPMKRHEGKKLAEGVDAMLILPMGKARLLGGGAIARYFARIAPPAACVYGIAGDALCASEVDSWIELCTGLGPAQVPSLLASLNTHLRMRTFVAAHAPSLADAAIWLLLRSSPDPDKACAVAGPHTKRWWAALNSTAAFKETAQSFFGESKDAASMEIPLPGAEMGKVVTRFPPEPSGYLHIGHVKAAMLNAYFANQFQGRMLLRFDDTNPSKEKGEYEDAIVQDLRSLDIVPSAVSHTSDHFGKILSIATRMLEQGLAYIDPSPQEEQQALRFKKESSPHRDAPVAENLRLWKEMQAASEEGLKCCMRAKIDPASDNGAMRDPTIYRCNLEPHHSTHDKFKVYPTYDLACPIVDSIEGVTHALRDRQYSDRDPQYAWFLDALKLRKVELWGFSRINFVRTLLSKRKLQWLVDQKRADGWDDPRFPTVAGILRRGMTVQGLKTFILSMGASKNTNLMEWDKIWAFNKAVLDPVVPRLTALVSEPGLVPLLLSNAPTGFFARSIAAHPKDETIGKKVRFYGPRLLLQAEDAEAIAEGEEVTLMSWGNAIVRRAVLEGGKLVRLEGELHLEGSVKTTKKKLTWLADTPDAVDVELYDFDALLTKDKVEEDDDINDILTPHTKFCFPARGEAAMRQLSKGDIIQVERRGFYICDVPYVRPSDPMRLFFVPDGKLLFGVHKPAKEDAKQFGAGRE
jgi:glutamyl-tRNA synthetase